MKEMKIKVCGMRNPDNIDELLKLKPDFLGFIFYPKSPRYVGEDFDPVIRQKIPDKTRVVGVFVDADPAYVNQKISNYSLNAVQLHGDESVEYCKTLKKTGVTVIKAFRVDSDFDFSEITPYQHAVDFVLFDTKASQHGGTGLQFDWALLKNYTCTLPYFLSGGISETDVPVIKNITDSNLYALDVNSKFEIQAALKDIPALSRFFTHIKS